MMPDIMEMIQQKSEELQNLSADWPYLTSESAPIPATIRMRDSDFRVEEIPAYEPCGTGEHIYLWIEKAGLSTWSAVQKIAHGLAISKNLIGVAGLKDAHALTSQWVSVEGVSPDQAEKLNIPGVKILKVIRHKNKLRIGHLRGNRFWIKLRETQNGHREEIGKILQALMKKGIPNYFGSQRFGAREDNWQVGQALIQKNYEKAAMLIAGNPGPFDEGAVREARALFDRKQYSEAAQVWPRGFDHCLRICHKMAKHDGDAERAVLSLDKNLLWFYLNTFQSWLFNHVLARRIGTLGMLFKGDLAYKHDNGAVFLVEDADKEKNRSDHFDISPSGPLFGYRMTEPEGEPKSIEDEVLDKSGIQKTDFLREGFLRCRGARRSLRVKMDSAEAHIGQDEAGEYVELCFSLPAGSYATSVLREIGKGHLKVGIPGKEIRRYANG